MYQHWGSEKILTYTLNQYSDPGILKLNMALKEVEFTNFESLSMFSDTDFPV
jgi:hypothetical protein